MTQRRFHMDGGFTTNADAYVSGNLSVTGTPTDANHVTTKDYTDAVVAGITASTRVEFLATEGQTTHTGLTYTVGNIDLYINGLKMLLATDFTATDGTSVTFTPALSLDDEIQFIMDASASVASTAAAIALNTAKGTADFIASGALLNGATVILKLDGTVEAVGGTVDNMTTTNFLGTATTVYSDGDTATILLQGGVSTNQTGLVLGSVYYVQADGTLSTVTDDPSVIAGKALSATSLLLKAY
jgi:hypothetical protein